MPVGKDPEILWGWRRSNLATSWSGSLKLESTLRLIKWLKVEGKNRYRQITMEPYHAFASEDVHSRLVCRLSDMTELILQALSLLDPAGLMQC
jgi:hypothetical protein